MGKDEMKKMLLCVARDACLADHMGDMWNSICDAATELGLELPERDDGEMDLDGIEKMGGVHLGKFVKEARPRNYPVPDEIEQVLVRGCEGCPCHAVYLSEKGDPPEDHCSLLDKEVFAAINLIDPECPLKKKHHILMLSTTED